MQQARAAALAMVLVGLPPALATDRVGGSPGGPGAAATLFADVNLAARPCPTRFDYLVLASFADAPSLLSLSSYHFRSEVGFSTIPLTGMPRVDYWAEPGAGECQLKAADSR